MMFIKLRHQCFGKHDGVVTSDHTFLHNWTILLAKISPMMFIKLSTHVLGLAKQGGVVTSCRS